MRKNLQFTIAWLVLGLLVVLTAIWQVQATLVREVLAKNQLPPPPTRTRHAERTATPAPSVADYADRKKQGLTDQEIGWIIKDFQNAGLDLGIRAASQEKYLTQRQAQDKWYHDVLVDTWCLTREQSAHITEKLGELYDQAKTDFVEAFADGPKPIEINGQWYIITSAEPIHRLIDVNPRLQDVNGPFMPWNLGGFPITSQTNPVVATGPQPTAVPIIEGELNLITVDFLLPRTAPSSGDEPLQVAARDKGILPQLRKLHPAQLKLLLLIDPEKTHEIQAALGAN